MVAVVLCCGTLENMEFTVGLLVVEDPVFTVKLSASCGSLVARPGGRMINHCGLIAYVAEHGNETRVLSDGFL